MNKIKSYQCAVFFSVSCHVIELPIAPHFINRKMIIATFYLLLSAYENKCHVLWLNQHCLLLPDLKVGFGQIMIMGRFKVGYCGKSLLGRLFEKILELTPTTTLCHI